MIGGGREAEDRRGQLPLAGRNTSSEYRMCCIALHEAGRHPERMRLPFPLDVALPLLGKGKVKESHARGAASAPLPPADRAGYLRAERLVEKHCLPPSVVDHHHPAQNS